LPKASGEDDGEASRASAANAASLCDAVSSTAAEGSSDEAAVAVESADDGSITPRAAPPRRGSGDLREAALPPSLFDSPLKHFFVCDSGLRERAENPEQIADGFTREDFLALEVRPWLSAC